MAEGEQLVVSGGSSFAADNFVCFGTSERQNCAIPALLLEKALISQPLETQTCSLWMGTGYTGGSNCDKTNHNRL